MQKKIAHIPKTWNGDIRMVEIFIKNRKKAIQFIAADAVVDDGQKDIFYFSDAEVTRCNKANCYYKVGAIVNFFKKKEA